MEPRLNVHNAYPMNRYNFLSTLLSSLISTVVFPHSIITKISSLVSAKIRKKYNWTDLI